MDEIGHLPAAVSHWKFGRFDLYRVNPPLTRIVAGVPAWISRFDYAWEFCTTEVGVRPEFGIGYYTLRKKGLSFRNEFWWPRVFSAVFSVIGAITIYTWTRAVVGDWAAFIACTLWCCSPSVLSFAGTVGPDVGSVTMGLLACMVAWRYLLKPSYRSAILSGLALGMAMLSKLTWITAGPVLFVTTVYCLWQFRGSLPARGLYKRFADVLVVVCTSLFTLNAGYLFEDTLKPLGEYKFCSEMLGGVGGESGVHGNRFKHTWLAKLPVPLPRNYLLGIDYLKYEVEEKKWSFLMGEWKNGSWPHYYIMTTLFKTPEPTLLAALTGLCVLIVGIRRKLVDPKVITMFLFLGIPACVAFASVSLQGGFNHHHRYVLQIYPPFFVLAAYVASPVAIRLLRLRLSLVGPKMRSVAVPLAIVFTSLSAASSLCVHPYYTSYFNTLSGGPENAWRLLSNSNIDWGQDLLEVDKWIKEHPECRPVAVDLDFFSTNGDMFGLPNNLPTELPKGASIDEIRADKPEWWIISVKRLYNKPGEIGLEYLQQLEPVDRIAYAYHVYRIDPKRVSSNCITGE